MATERRKEIKRRRKRREERLRDRKREAIKAAAAAKVELAGVEKFEAEEQAPELDDLMRQQLQGLGYID